MHKYQEKQKQLQLMNINYIANNLVSELVNIF